MKYSTASYLMHYGVTGQKWGVRRYQNPDGSLTPEGRQHYGLGDLDYNARYSGDKKSAKKAYKAERKKLRNKVFDAYDIDEKEWDDDYAKLDKDENIGDHHEYRNAEKELFETSDKMYSSYEAGLKEVDRYLAGKYGQETINSIKRGDKAKAIAIGAGAVAGSTILGVGIWHGNKAHKNNQMRKDEDNAFIKVSDSTAKFKDARKKSQEAYEYEQRARQEAAEAGRNYRYPDTNDNFKDFGKYRDHMLNIEKQAKESKARAAAKGTREADEARNRYWKYYDRDYFDYNKKADKREANAQGLWRRKGDDERDKRHKNMDYLKDIY